MSCKLTRIELDTLINDVQRINDEILGKVHWTEYLDVTLISLSIVPPSTFASTIGFTSIIVNCKGQSITIWSSEDDNDTRIRYDNDKYESWYRFIRRQWKETREAFFNETL